MVNALKQHCSPLAAGKYRKSSKRSTQWCHQTNGGKSGLEAETVRALGALRSLRSKKEVAAGKSQEMHFSSDDQTKKRVEDYVEGETAGARQRVEDAEAAVQQEEEDMEKAEMRDWWTDSTTTLFGIWWSLSEIVWVILQILTMGRMGKMRMMKRQGMACWEKMINPAGWWAQSPIQYSSAWRCSGRSRWSLTNWHNRDGMKQPTTSVNEGRCVAHQNRGFRQSLNCKWIMIDWLLHRQ